MIDPEIYLKAAKEMLVWNPEELSSECHRVACGALSDACDGYGVATPYRNLFAEYFKPDNLTERDKWFGSTFSSKNHQTRILALLFMYEIAKDIQ